MKKILSTLLVATLAATFAQAIQIDLLQKVSKKESRRGDYYGSGSTNYGNKSVERSKIFNVRISNVVPIEVVAIFYATTGGKMYSHIIEGIASHDKPLQYEYTSGVATSSTYKYYDDNKKYTYGNDKVEACVFVFEKKTCKLSAQKFTSKTFADRVLKSDYDKMIEKVKSLSQENQ